MNRKLSILFLISELIILSFGATIPPKITCKDESGKPIDWFTVYKLPRTSTGGASRFQALGSAYTFITDKNQEWTLSKNPLNASSIVSETINVLYNTAFTNDQKLGYVLYNDQYDSDSSARAHAKGIIIFDEVSAIWLAHSIPHFPPRPSSGKFDIDEDQMKFGQSMICLSLPFSALSQVGLQLMYAFPQTFDSFIPTSMASNPVLQNLINAAAGKRVTTAPWARVENLKTLGNNQFMTFYKHTKFADDLYVNFVAKTLKTNLFTETWSRGVGTEETNCTMEYKVYNIKRVKFDTFNIDFPVTNDHSKWAISEKNENPNKYICIGDINRQTSQTKRGGGTICFVNNEKVWNQYYNIVEELEPCPAQV